MGSLQSIYLLEGKTCVINHYSEFSAEAVHYMNTNAQWWYLGIFYQSVTYLYSNHCDKTLIHIVYLMA